MPKRNRRFQKSNSSPTRDKKPHDHKATYDTKRLSEETKSVDKNPCKDREKHMLEAKNSKESSGNKSLSILNPPDPQIEKEPVTGQIDKNTIKPKPQLSHSSRLSSDLTRETDEAAFEPDYNESDSESNVSIKEEETAGKVSKELKDKVVEKAKESLDTAAVSQAGVTRSQSQSSPSVSPSRSHSPSGSQTRSHSSSASSAESQDSKKKKKKKEKKSTRNIKSIRSIRSMQALKQNWKKPKTQT